MSIVWGPPENIRKRSRAAVADSTLRLNLERASENERTARRRMEERLDWEPLRRRAAAHRADTLRHLPELVEDLRRSVENAGGTVVLATTGVAAAEYVVNTCLGRNARTVVKGKSMMTEEIALNDALAAAGIEVVETDLGEYIVQQRGDRPSHILVPAIHLAADEVARQFSDEAGRRINAADTGALVSHARTVLREKFASADVGITGANFAIAETGTIVIVESEGNIRISSSLPRCHIVVMGIEKVVRSPSQAAHLVKMVSLAHHGKPIPAGVSLITGPARNGDDGPDELHLVLVDNGRSEIATGKYRDVLKCIRCAACLAVCPVYRQAGGHTYGSCYSGPIGAVVSPLLAGIEKTGAIADLSTLCGACRETCPVEIPLDRLLVELRNDHRRSAPERGERALFKAWTRLWNRPAVYNALAKAGGRVLFPLIARAAPSRSSGRQCSQKPSGWISKAPFPLSRWTLGRDFPNPAETPFHERWRRRRQINDR